MAAKIEEVFTDSGQTVYDIWIRDADGKLRANTDGGGNTQGAFYTNPADAHKPLSPDAVVSTKYTSTESRVPMDDGWYTVLYFSQVGATWDSDVDTLLMTEKKYIEGDSEILSEGVVQSIYKSALHKMVINPSANTLTIYENDGVTPFKVFDLASAGPIVAYTSRTPQ